MLSDYDFVLRMLEETPPTASRAEAIALVKQLRDRFIKQKAQLNTCLMMNREVVINIEGVEFKPKEAENATKES